MIDQFWDDFFRFWFTAGVGKIFSTFWYFFLLEVPRYILVDILVVVLSEFQEKMRWKKYQIAQNTLWSDMPLISIIVPGKNEGQHIYKLVTSLKEQTYKNFEIIIVDDGSTDDTPIICKNLKELGLIDVYFRNDVRGGKASAANLAFRYTTGKFIVHLDADTSFDVDSIERIIIPFYLNPKIGAVGGNVRVRNAEDNICTSVQSIEYMQTISLGRKVASLLGLYKIVSGAFGAFRREPLERIYGWDIGPGLDGDITVKIRKMGYKVVFESRAVCLTNVPTTFKALRKQRTRWSKSLIRFRLRKHKDVFFPIWSFSFLNMFASAENIFFSLVLDLLWFVYLFTMLISNADILIFIFPMKIIIYLFASIISFLAALAVSERKRDDMKLALYLPLMMFYMGYYLRFIRTSAYLNEFFTRNSYKDSWNPAKSSRQAKLNKI